MDVLVGIDVVDGRRRTVRYNNVCSWRIVNLFVNALFVPGGQWCNVRYRSFWMKRMDKPEPSETTP